MDDSEVPAAIDGTEWLDNLPLEQLASLHEMLAVAQKQIDDGLGVDFDIEDILARSRARRTARARAAAE